MRQLRLARVWQALVDYCGRGRRPLRVRLHGFPALLNPGNPYPFILAENPGFNEPLVQLVRQVHRHLGRPLVVIDVGASIGNTALLLAAECGEALGRLHCLEGDADFLAYLQHNTARLARVTVYHAMLARAVGVTRALQHHHPGTAGAIGDRDAPATTLDHLMLVAESRFDVLKSDIDGSDGEALAGAAQLLARDHPAVIFEWHPFLIREAGHAPETAFSTLCAAGYRTFLWFTNQGNFSHFSAGEPAEVEKWNRALLALRPYGDPHFDVIALPESLSALELPLATFGVAT